MNDAFIPLALLNHHNYNIYYNRCSQKCKDVVKNRRKQLLTDTEYHLCMFHHSTNYVPINMGKVDLRKCTNTHEHTHNLTRRLSVEVGKHHLLIMARQRFLLQFHTF